LLERAYTSISEAGTLASVVAFGSVLWFNWSTQSDYQKCPTELSPKLSSVTNVTVPFLAP